jgi:hypothetical protein
MPQGRGIGPTFEPGNINLYSRPRVRNPDNSTSTVNSMSFGEDNREILIPTVEEYGSGILSDEDAIKQYYRTKKHLGMFRTPDEATAYAKRLHDAYARGDFDVPLASSRKSIDPTQFGKVLERYLRKGPTGLE